MTISDYAAKRRGITIAEDAKNLIHVKVVEAYRNRDNKFGNARYINTIIEEGKQNELMDAIKNDLNQYTSFVFEKISQQFLWSVRPMKFNKLGRWWHKDKEIDLVGLNENKKEILFVECKWSSNVNPEKVLKELKEKVQSVDWNNNKRKEYYCVIAKSFSKKIEEDNVFLFDLADIKNG